MCINTNSYLNYEYDKRKFLYEASYKVRTSYIIRSSYVFI